MRYKYPLSMRIFHWLIFVMIIGMYSAAYTMTNLSDDMPVKWEIFSLHKATGVVLLLLILLRFFNRMVKTVPEYQKPLPPLHQWVSKINFKLLYLVMILMPVSGILMSIMGGYPIDLYLFTIPAITKDPVIGGIAHEAHEWISYILIALVSLHLLGFLFNLFFEKNNLLKRIL